MSGTHDNSIAGGPYRASNALACRTLADVGEATATAARANQYVVQAPRTFPVVATSTGTSQLPEFLTTRARGTSDESGRMVAAAKLHANKTSRLRAPSVPRPSHSLRGGANLRGWTSRWTARRMRVANLPAAVRPLQEHERFETTRIDVPLAHLGFDRVLGRGVRRLAAR